MSVVVIVVGLLRMVMGMMALTVAMLVCNGGYRADCRGEHFGADDSSGDRVKKMHVKTCFFFQSSWIY